MRLRTSDSCHRGDRHTWSPPAPRWPAFNRKATPPVQQATIPSIPVVAGLVTTQDVPIYLHGIGTVIAYNTVTVRSQIQGQLTQIAFTEGQTVRAGDLLALIDPRPYQAQLDQMVANRDRDQAQLTNAQLNLDRDTQSPARVSPQNNCPTPKRRKSRSCRAPSKPTKP